MLDKIRGIICEGDPLDLFPLAPKDEYCEEIKLIYQAVCETKEAAVLGEKIQNIFLESFGGDYSITIEECTKIATFILSNNNDKTT